MILKSRNIIIVSLACFICAYVISEVNNNDKLEAIENSTLHAESEGIVQPLIEKSKNDYLIQIFSGKRWEVYRRSPSGYLEFKYDGKSVALSSDEIRKYSYPQFIVEGVDGGLFFGSYNVLKNSPSGHKLNNIKKGTDIYYIGSKSNVIDVEHIASGVQIGGIDDQIYALADTNSIHVCGAGNCVTVSNSKKQLSWNLGDISGFEFVEVVFRKKKAAAILRKKHDDRFDGLLNQNYDKYYLSIFDPQGISSIDSIKDGIPWHLIWNDNLPKFKVAKNRSDLRDILLFEFNRLGVHGTLEIGSNNLEGRIAWNQVYYLHALLSLYSSDSMLLSNIQQTSIKKRLEKEFSLLQEMCVSNYPGYKVKRYSLDREPITFALHLARISKLLVRAKNKQISIKSNCLKSLENTLTELSDTAEKHYTYNKDSEVYKYLQFKYGIPFLSDGANVPYNFVSGYVEGLLALNNNFRKDAHGFLSTIIKNEFSTQLPNAWRYWWGPGDMGWQSSDTVSLNNPSYAGNNNALAHITYRTMDAKAILALEYSDPGSVSKDLIDHFRKLTQKGLLLPDMNEYWSEMDGTVAIDTSVAKRYARSTSPWELQSQFWALKSMALEDNND